MNLLVISDVHIGLKYFFLFGWKSTDFLKFLQYYAAKKKIDKIILNGDIFEMYQYKYESIVQANKPLIDYFHSPEFVYLKGNHDIFNSYGALNHLIINQKGKSIYIEHGHEADFLNGTAVGRWIGRLFFRLISRSMQFSLIKRFIHSYLSNANQLNRNPRKYNRYKYLNYALQLLKKYDVVVLGHTHILEVHKTYYLNKKKIYANSGSCSLGRFQALLIDTEALKVKTIKFSKRKVQNKLKKLTQNTEIKEHVLL